VLVSHGVQENMLASNYKHSDFSDYWQAEYVLDTSLNTSEIHTAVCNELVSQKLWGEHAVVVLADELVTEGRGQNHVRTEGT
jgi:hypothetical protein